MSQKFIYSIILPAMVNRYDNYRILTQETGKIVYKNTTAPEQYHTHAQFTEQNNITDVMMVIYFNTTYNL